MKVKYKGFEINLNKEKALGGWTSIYYYIVDKDGEYVVDSFTEEKASLTEFVKHLKNTVDDIIKNPNDYYDDI